jgi:colicin import membrane protein
MESDMTDKPIDGEVVGDELALVEIADFKLPAPTEFKERLEGVFSKMYADIDADLARRTVDLSTDKGRKQVAADAYRISKLKTAMAAKASELVADQKAIISTVTKTRQEMEAEFDKRRDLARAPLTAWEETVKITEERASAERAFMLTIRAQSVDGVLVADMTSSELANLCEDRKNMEFTPEMYGDASTDLWASNVVVIDWLKEAHQSAKDSERDALELAELRQMRVDKEAKEAADEAEREAREESERERIAEEEAAALAETAAKEEAERERIADEKAKVERDAEDARRKEQVEKDAREKADADAAEKIKAAEDASRIEIEKAKADAAAVIKKADDERAAKEKADRDRIAADEAETKRREEDKDHRRAINRNILTALAECGLNDEQAKAVIVAVAQGHVPHVSIKY